MLAALARQRAAGQAAIYLALLAFMQHVQGQHQLAGIALGQADHAHAAAAKAFYFVKVRGGVDFQPLFQQDEDTLGHCDVLG